jgi:hypothetical protein
MKDYSVEPSRARPGARLRRDVSERNLPMLQKNSRAIGLANEPIGILPNGTINVVKIDDPPFEPTVYDARGVTLLEPGRSRASTGEKRRLRGELARPEPLSELAHLKSRGGLPP